MTNKRILRKKEMETVEISVSTQNIQWVQRQGQGTYRLERPLNHIFSVVLPFILLQQWKTHVDVYVTIRGRMQLTSRAGG